MALAFTLPDVSSEHKTLCARDDKIAVSGRISFQCNVMQANQGSS